jgi:hypothetical protein
METTFGTPEPTLFQMIASNPGAVWDHVLWNISLTGNGFQVALFNATAGKINPDYVPVHMTWLAWIPTVALCFIVIWACVLDARDPSVLRSRIETRVDLWLLMGAVLCVAGLVIATQRPRPSYLFSATVVLMAVAGLAADVILRRWPTGTHRVALVVTLVILLMMPSFYAGKPMTRSLLSAYENLLPFSEELAKKGNKLVLGNHAGELVNYLLLTGTAETYGYDILAARSPDERLDAFLRRKNINGLYVQPTTVTTMNDIPGGQDLLNNPQSLGWHQLRPATAEKPDWILLMREQDSM